MSSKIFLCNIFFLPENISVFSLGISLAIKIAGCSSANAPIHSTTAMLLEQWYKETKMMFLFALSNSVPRSLSEQGRPDTVVLLRQQQPGQVFHGQLDIGVLQQTWVTQHVRRVRQEAEFANVRRVGLSPLCCASSVRTEVAVICRLALLSTSAENTMLHRDVWKAKNKLSSNNSKKTQKKIY